MNSPQQPPIPSPFSNAPPTQSKPNYAPMILCGVVVFALTLGLSFVVPAWMIFAAVSLPLFIAAFYGTFFVKRVGEQMNYALRSTSDLQLVRQAIDLNMKLAFLFVVMMCPLLVLALIRGAWICSLALMAFTIPFGAWSTSVEAKFKAMRSDDESLNAQFQNLLARWKEPGFGLKADS